MSLRYGSLLIAVLILILASPAWARPAMATTGQGMRLSFGVGLGVLELHGLREAWGLAQEQRTVRLLQGVVEFGRPGGLGVRFIGEFGLPDGPKISKFETAFLFHLPGRTARVYLGGGSGLLFHKSKLNFSLHLALGLKMEMEMDLLRATTIFFDAKLIGIIDLKDSLFLPRPPLQLTPGLAFHF